MKAILVLLFFCAIGIVAGDSSSSSSSSSEEDDQPVVTAPIGRIRGSTWSTRLGRKIYGFRGIRYAEPPTGRLRFQPPVPAKDWRNVFDGTEEGPSCPQPVGKEISEDCLRLNVYTTKLPCERENVSRPVMIFIHPGGFYSMSGQSGYFGPEYLLDHDVVLVTINYRLGTLGFLNTGDSNGPGNMGLKDQVVAFRWVQRNIAAFGGNPNEVTLCGYSAGSFSIMLHMVSPMSKNLFHRAITMSSSPFRQDVYDAISHGGQTHLVKKHAEILGCPTDTSSSMINCLSTKPVENFTNTLSSLFDWYGNPILLWKPSIEPEVPGIERFLSEDPYDLVRQGKFHQVPLILGCNEEEFGGVVSFYDRNATFGNGSLYRELNDDWQRLAPIIFMYERDTPRSRYITNELRQFYFKDQPISPATSEQLEKIYADSVIIFPMYRTAKIFATYSTQPVYFYKFTYEGRYSFYKFNDTTTYGASHHDDLQYLFYIKNLFPFFESDAPEIPMVEIYTAMWSNFVQTGEPIPRNNEMLRNVRWTTFVPSRNNFLDINLHPTMKTEFFPERMRFWERLFPLPRNSKSVKQ